MAKHRKVESALAKGCIDSYVKTYQGTTDAAIKAAYTDGTIFDREDLITYLKSIKTPSVKFTFGVYTDEYVKKYPMAKNNRMTAFVFPSTVIVPDIPLTHAAYIAPGDGGDGLGDPLNISTLNP